MRREQTEKKAHLFLRTETPKANAITTEGNERNAWMTQCHRTHFGKTLLANLARTTPTGRNTIIPSPPKTACATRTCW